MPSLYEQRGALNTSGTARAAATAAPPGAVPERPADGAAAPTAEPEPAPAPAAAAPAVISGSLIRQGTVFDGKYQGAGDLTVEGEIRGNIDCKGSLIIREGATVKATVAAAVIQAAGKLTGDVVCSERFEAAPTAQVAGHITTPRLIIQDGARCDGQITMAERT